MPDELWHLHGTWWLGPDSIPHPDRDGRHSAALPRLPPGIAVAGRRAARAIAAALVLSAGIAALPMWLSSEARWQADPGPGPLLRQAQARGELVVGVHAYPRATPPGRPLVPEPDPGEAGLAAELGRALGLPVRLRHLPAAGNTQSPGFDLAFGAAADSRHPRAASVQAPATARGTLLTLRFTPVDRLDSLGGKTACVSEGSPFQAALARAGAELRRYPSPLQALLAFRRGECAAVAEDAALAARVMRRPEWRFFVAAPLVLNGEGAALTLREPDAQSARYLEQLLARWQRDGRLGRLREAAAGEAAFNMMLVESGQICH